MIAWRMAWREALRRRRLFAWNVAVPLLLLAPVALSEAAAPHRVAVFGVFFVFFGTFGSAIPTVRDAREGWLDELFGAGAAAVPWAAGRALAGAAIDLLQLLPSSIVLLAASGGWAGAPGAVVGIAWALLFANLLGPVVAALVRSMAEAAMACAAVSLILLHYAGFFRAAGSGWTATAAAWNPYRPLREALAAGVAGRPPELAAWAPAVAAGLVLGALILALAARWTGRFRWPHAA